ncbi:hypothetical protein LNV09_00450 [Paucibacter sp. B2R-40]|uniref:hypothetical protein n=1 Tax=Paucibacter sp. B2R-40 TaxID=2893554 RepID=UPI0021E47C67|nr:hypothetical protein [Paucibacter sp. B2R-40]MCV2352623.1 hypothetical protein [Paucibacter sp. B2R-40]
MGRSTSLAPSHNRSQDRHLRVAVTPNILINKDELMWKCKHCSKSIEDEFDACWSCGYSKEGIPPDKSINSESAENRAELAREKNKSNAKGTLQVQMVSIVDASIPFWSMVFFMIKWALASIPAILILLFTFSVIGALFGGLFRALF